MTNAIALLYDLSTKENVGYTVNILTALAQRGIAFDFSASEEKKVCLIVDGSVYAPKFIEANPEEVLRHVERTDRMMRQRGLERFVVGEDRLQAGDPIGNLPIVR